MNKREVGRMSRHERRAALRDAAGELNSALNLFGVDREPVSGLLDLTEEDSVMERSISEIMQPECSCRKGCSHPFPPWFVREAEPYARAYIRLFRQVQSVEGLS